MPDPLIGAIVGERYRLTEEIGVGGMATVYRGEHLLLRKPVAVKVLLPELSTDEDMAARFEREAVAAARLEHPNIVSITDFGRTPDGRMFLVMEFLEGTPLADIIADELHLGWERAVEIVRQVLRGLGHAHDMGVVHRDLKPSNVMVTAHATGPKTREVAKIIDFGIAKIIAESSAGPKIETETGIIFGTADFLAPERLLGKGDADPRSDVYSAGIILYEALTGERPFHDADPYVTVQRALNEPPKAPSSVVAGIPAAIDAVVAKALAKRPEDRFESARAMLAALDPVARSSGVMRFTPPPRIDTGSSLPVDDVLAGVPLTPYPPPEQLTLRKRLLWVLPLVAGALVLSAALASRSSRGGFATLVPPAGQPSTKGANAETELAAAIKQAAEGETVVERQRAFDRLVALGYGDRVPWVPMLARDLEQLPTCEERREVVLKLKNTRDPKALPYLEKAAERPDNACLSGEAREAVAMLGGAPAAVDINPPPTPPPAAKKKRSRGGGHF